MSKDILSGLQGRIESYTGDLVAEPIAGLQNLLRGFEGINPDDLGGAVEALQPALSGRPSYALSPELTQQAFQSGVAAPLLRTYDTEIAPRVREAFAGQGAAFSTRSGDAQRRALEDLNTKLTAELVNRQREDQFLAAQLAESAAGRQQQASGQAADLANQLISRRLALQQGFNPYQTLAQAELDTRYSEFLRTQYENSPWIQHALNFTGQQQTYLQQQPSTLQQIAGVSSVGSNLLALGLLGGSFYSAGPTATLRALGGA